MSALVFESRLPVGSSANTTAGRESSARAIATRCCCPPESSAGRWVAAVRQADGVEQRALPLGIGLAAGDRERQLDVLLRRQHRQQVEELEDEADLVAAQPRQLLVVEPDDLGSVDRDRARRRRVEPGEDVHERRLPGAGRAHDRGELAARKLGGDAAKRVHDRVALAVAPASRRSPTTTGPVSGVAACGASVATGCWLICLPRLLVNHPEGSRV